MNSKNLDMIFKYDYNFSTEEIPPEEYSLY
jgi:hypothetical protein